MNLKQKYLSSAFLLILSTVLVKAIGAVYKIPLTSFIGAVGRGYFSYAYNICMPVHAITMGAFPIALSKLVGKYNFLNNTNILLSLKRSSQRLFFWIGALGMGAVLLFSSAYCSFIVKSPKSIYTVLVLAPSILFSTMAASYRGYYEGFLNMVPTAVSQSLEAVIKMVFGLAFAKLSMVYLFEQYQLTGYVLGTLAKDDTSALSLIYPFTSCASMLGVSFGSFVSLCYLWLYDRYKNSCSLYFKYQSTTKEILGVAYPIMISTGVQSIFQFLDTVSVQYALNCVEKSTLGTIYYSSIFQAGIGEQDYTTYLYGILATSLDFKNIIPGITMALGVSAVPAISRVWEAGDSQKLSSTINSVIKYTIVLSSLGGLALCFCAREILVLFYANSSPDIIDVAVDLVRWYGLSTFAYCVAGTSVFCVQALGETKRSIPSYIASGVIRVVLNLALVQNESFVLMGAVISGAVGYVVLAVWNIAILCQKTSFSFDFKTNVFGASIAFGGSFFIIDFLQKSLDFGKNNFINIVLVGFGVFLVYCILCILCGMLNFRRFFRDFNNKKVSLKT